MLNLFSCFFCLWSSQAWITLDRAQLNFGEPDSATENFLGAIAIKMILERVKMTGTVHHS
ncbi:hypothetical protein D5086_011126, partial [Populus alba]